MACQYDSKTCYWEVGVNANLPDIVESNVRWDLHENVTNIEDTEQGVEFLSLEIEVVLETAQTCCTV